MLLKLNLKEIKTNLRQREWVEKRGISAKIGRETERERKKGLPASDLMLVGQSVMKELADDGWWWWHCAVKEK